MLLVMRFLALLPLFFMLSCNNSPNTTMVPDEGHMALVDSAATETEEPDSIPAEPASTVVTYDSTNLTPEPTTPIKIMLAGAFHKDEVWQGVQTKQWIALTFRDGRYNLQPARLSVKPVYDPIGDDDSLHISGREVSSNVPDAIFYITGLNSYNRGTIDTVAFKKDVLAPGSTVELPFKGKAYTLSAFGDSTLADSTSRYYNISNYGWKVSGTKNGKKLEQVLSQDEQFDLAVYVLLWVGDLDGDGIPDILADLSNHYNGSSVTLFLSSKAPAGKLYGKAATFETVGC